MPENETGGTITETAPAPSAERSYQPPESERETPAATPKEVAPKDGEAPKPIVQKGGLKVAIPKPRSRFQERISDLVAERNRHEGEARSLREEMAKLRGEKTGKLPGQRTDGLTEGVDLKPEDFETYGEYIQALVQRTIAAASQKDKEQRSESSVLEYRQKQLDSFQGHAAPLIEQHGDAFMEAISDPSLPVSEAMADAVLELDELGPYVMLYLAANQQESAKIARMNPRAATVAIGRLAAKLDYEIKGGEGTPATGETTTPQEAAPAPPPKRPAPSVVPTPRGGSPTNLDQTPNDKDDLNTWMQKEAARLRGKYGPNYRAYGMR